MKPPPAAFSESAFAVVARRALEVAAVAVISLLVLDVLYGVLTRYAFGAQPRWSEELARLLLVWLTLLGAALATLSHAHLGVDILVRRLHPDARRIAIVFAQLVVLVFALVVLTYGGGRLCHQRWASGQILPALGVSKAWFYLALPFSGALISLFSLGNLVDAWHGRLVLDPEAPPVDVV